MDQTMRGDRSIVECPRRDCDVKGRMYSGDGPLELLPEWEWLIGMSRRVLRSEEYRGHTLSIHQVLGGPALDIDLRVHIGSQDVTRIMAEMDWWQEDWIECSKHLIDLAYKSELVEFLAYFSCFHSTVRESQG